jgi:hypothetical protein
MKFQKIFYFITILYKVILLCYYILYKENIQIDSDAVSQVI